MIMQTKTDESLLYRTKNAVVVGLGMILYGTYHDSLIEN